MTAVDLWPTSLAVEACPELRRVERLLHANVDLVYLHAGTRRTGDATATAASWARMFAAAVDAGPGEAREFGLARLVDAMALWLAGVVDEVVAEHEARRAQEAAAGVMAWAREQRRPKAVRRRS